MARKKNTSKIKSSRFSSLEFAMYVAAFALIGIFTLWVSFAAPHKTSASGSIALKLPPDTDNNGDGLPNWGDSVSFNITSSAAQPFVHLLCNQSGKQVLDSWNGYYAGSPYLSRSFGLSTGLWTSGAADCNAYLEYYSSQGKGSWVIQASTSFHVYA